MIYELNAGGVEPRAKRECLGDMPGAIWLLGGCNFIVAALLVVFSALGASDFILTIGAAAILATPFLLVVPNILNTLRKIAISKAPD